MLGDLFEGLRAAVGQAEAEPENGALAGVEILHDFVHFLLEREGGGWDFCQCWLV